MYDVATADTSIGDRALRSQAASVEILIAVRRAQSPALHFEPLRIQDSDEATTFCRSVVNVDSTSTTQIPHRLCRVVAGRGRSQPVHSMTECPLLTVIPGCSRLRRTGLSRRRSRVRVPSLPSRKACKYAYCVAWRDSALAHPPPHARARGDPKRAEDPSNSKKSGPGVQGGSEVLGMESELLDTEHARTRRVRTA